MTTQHIETLIIGAGQAGLATGYHLKQFDREFLILDNRPSGSARRELALPLGLTATVHGCLRSSRKR